jgi:hypothetical protein
VNVINTYIPLPFTYNVKNSVQLVDEVKSIPYNPNLRFASFDISNMYTNIPTNQLPDIIKHLRTENNVDSSIQTELQKLCSTVLAQIYFQFNNSYYLQEHGLAMGSPTFSIFSELYLQHLENTIIFEILVKYKNVGYFRYVNDILIVYNEYGTDIHEVLSRFNNMSLTIYFTIETERNNSINYVDINITRNNNFCFNIYI